MSSPPLERLERRGRRRRPPSLPLPALERLSLAHSTVYCCLLTVWLVPGLPRLEMVFGFAHGIGWIAMVALVLLALSARVVSLRIAVAVAVLGAIAPFFGSWELVRESRRRAARGAEQAISET